MRLSLPARSMIIIIMYICRGYVYYSYRVTFAFNNLDREIERRVMLRTEMQNIRERVTKGYKIREVLLCEMDFTT